jgi:hypothetical protein
MRCKKKGAKIMKRASFKFTVSLFIAWLVQAIFFVFSSGVYLTPSGTKFFIGFGVGISLVGAFILLLEEHKKVPSHKNIIHSINKTFRAIQQELPGEAYDIKWLEWNKPTLVAYLEYIRRKPVSSNLNRLIQTDLDMLHKI